MLLSVIAELWVSASCGIVGVRELPHASCLRELPVFATCPPLQKRPLGGDEAALNTLQPSMRRRFRAAFNSAGGLRKAALRPRRGRSRASPPAAARPVLSYSGGSIASTARGDRSGSSTSSSVIRYPCSTPSGWLS